MFETMGLLAAPHTPYPPAPSAQVGLKAVGIQLNNPARTFWITFYPDCIRKKY